MNVFIGPVPIGNYYSLLAKGLQEIGVNADYITFFGNPLSFLESQKNFFLEVISKVGGWRAKIDRKEQLFLKVVVVFFHVLLISFYLPYLIYKYEVFIFGYGQSLVLGNWDLSLLKLFKKRVIIVFNGSDSRPEYLDGSLLANDRWRYVSDIIRSVKYKKKRLNRIEKYADVIVNATPQHILMRRFYVHALTLGLLNFENEVLVLGNNLQTKNNSGRIRILHSPTHPEAKGTPVFREIISRLKDKYPVDWIEIVNSPHQEVLLELGKCDFVVDQLYSDTPMAGFATEAAWHGKPAVVGGYWADEIHMDMKDDLIPPSEYVHPDKIETAIERLIVDANYRQELGQKARYFVVHNWNRKIVAQRWKRIIDGDIPEDWWRDPEQSKYYLGCGISSEKVRCVVRDVIDQGGVEALQLEDKPLLRDRLVSFALEGKGKLV